MSVPILFLLSFIAMLGGKIFSKLCSNILSQNSVAKYSLALVINSFVACCFFGIFGEFQIVVNKATLLYSIIYAVIVAVAIISGVVVYRYASISNVNIVSSSCGMGCTAVVGWMLFSEKMGILNVVRLLIMLVATAFAFLDQKKKESDMKPPEERKKGTILSLTLIIAMMTVCGCANTVVLKAFAMSERVTDENSFFFFTNVLLLIVALIVFIVACLRNRGELKDSLQLLHPKKLVAIGGNTVCSNILSLVSVCILERIDISIYSPISSALGIVVGLVGSLMFQERLGVFAYIAAAVACIAVVI